MFNFTTNFGDKLNGLYFVTHSLTRKEYFLI